MPNAEEGAVEAAFWGNLAEQAEHGPNVDFGWLLDANCRLPPGQGQS